MIIEIFQYPIVWESREENFALIRQSLEQRPPEPGTLLILPEMYSTGFSMAVKELAEPAAGPSSDFLRTIAMEFGVVAVGSFPRQCPEGGKALNRLKAFGPDGVGLTRYDKIHPFTYGQEADHFRGGRRLQLFDFQGWRICPTICYDLRFPELYRRAVLEHGAELILVIANWPTRRREHWNALLKARAIENQAFVVGVNRVGNDPNTSYSGDSVAIDPMGNDLLRCSDEVGRFAVRLERDLLLDWRAQFPALKDATEAFEVGAGA